ncbi:hypothetical protein GWI33_016263 [Rhynchophorus ferrugineus]|uniref:Uncharacterized protein n=1 Tax=Rhynchophorus ferrugineus TaxID=354439 RepID=A0A834IBH4_RHYFE|nr:hypothetical protein GWI33_016263 [Rhynchophorus ferrugineus]
MLLNIRIVLTAAESLEFLSNDETKKSSSTFTGEGFDHRSGICSVSIRTSFHISIAPTAAASVARFRLPLPGSVNNRCPKRQKKTSLAREKLRCQAPNVEQIYRFDTDAAAMTIMIWIVIREKKRPHETWRVRRGLPRTLILKKFRLVLPPKLLSPNTNKRKF